MQSTVTNKFAPCAEATQTKEKPFLRDREQQVASALHQQENSHLGHVTKHRVQALAIGDRNGDRDRDPSHGHGHGVVGWHGAAHHQKGLLAEALVPCA